MAGYTCSCCGKQHVEPPNCFIAPLPVPVLSIAESDRSNRVEASSDLCILDGEHYFILGNIDVRVQDSADFIRWTMWTSLSQSNFARATGLWDTPGREGEPPYFGWLCSQVPGYESTLSLKTQVHTQAVGVRPLIEVEPIHQLGLDQVNGITRQRCDALIHAAMATFPAAQEGSTPKPWWKVW